MKKRLGGYAKAKPECERMDFLGGHFGNKNNKNIEAG